MRGSTFSRLSVALVLGLWLGLTASSRADVAISAALKERLVRGTGWVLTPSSGGTGALIDTSKRWMLTNYHVVKEEAKVKVIFADFNKQGMIFSRDYYWKNWQRLAINGTVIHRDATRDLALIRLDSLPNWVRPLPFAAEEPVTDDLIFRLGSPSSPTAWEFSSGKVQTLRQQNLRYATGQVVKARAVISDNAGINGHSGAGVINSKGQLVGVHAADQAGKSQAISLAEVRGFLSTLPGVARARDLASESPSSDSLRRGELSVAGVP